MYDQLRDLTKRYLTGDLDQCEFNNLLRDLLGDISQNEHNDFVKTLAHDLRCGIGYN